jgi:ADP-heptose:LPS heptosyltransferase
MVMMPKMPKNILLPRFDTHGDIILLKGFIDALLDRFPQAEITLYVRAGYDQLRPLFSPRLTWVTQPFNPWAQYTDSQLHSIVTSLNQVACQQWDLVICTTYNRTFLEDILLSMLEKALCVGLGRQSEYTAWQLRTFNYLNLTQGNFFDILVPVEEKIHETLKYQLFYDALFAANERVHLPAIEVTDQMTSVAMQQLAELGLESGRYVVCMPAGTQNVPIKKWPAERFAVTLKWIADTLGLETLLVGHESERETIEEVALLAEREHLGIKVWFGNPGEMEILAALLKQSALYLGNDSAPMHLAAAVGTPTVGIFGGGTWPRFTAIGTCTISVVAELPCFYCMWECAFGDAPCLSFIQGTDVQAAVLKIMARDLPEGGVLKVIVPEALPREFIQMALDRRIKLSTHSKWVSEELKRCRIPNERAKQLEAPFFCRFTAPLRRMLAALRKA